ncbi:MAG: hypothetical protein IJO79_02270, partial [Firmicutes bacterium]|nr:hypothetical protein [Bacillota bacterium]
SIRSQEDWEEVMDELMDRFGTPPRAAENLTRVALIRGLAEKAGISRIHREQGKTIYDFQHPSVLTAPKAMEMVSIYGNRLMIYAGSNPYMKCSGEDRHRLKDTLEFLTNFLK